MPCLHKFFIILLSKAYLFWKSEFLRNRWLIGQFIVLIISFVDLAASISTKCSEVRCLLFMKLIYRRLIARLITTQALFFSFYSLPFLRSYNSLLLLVCSIFVFKYNDDIKIYQIFTTGCHNFYQILGNTPNVSEFSSQIQLYRVRRFFRPYFFISGSQMLKKTIKCLWNTLPELSRYPSHFKICLIFLLIIYSNNIEFILSVSCYFCCYGFSAPL